jgi:AraC family transcriptional regulator, exoenzyme S synthesis regulatory protein ExsA
VLAGSQKTINMFTLPDNLPGYKPKTSVFYYLHINDAQTNNSRLHLTTPCISIGINGTKKLQTAKGIEVFGQDDLIIYTPGNYLSYQNIDTDTDQPYRSLMIFFDSHAVDDLMRQFRDKDTTTQRAGDGYDYISLRGDSYVSVFARSILDLLASEYAFTDALQQVKLLELVVYLKGIFGNIFKEDQLHSKELSDKQLKRVIEDHHHANLSLGEFAFMCNMSLATFKRSFVRIYGTSPGKWMRDKKLLWAEEQIRDFQRLPKEVYREAGYEDYSSFSYAFKQKFGVSPRQNPPRSR